MQTRIRRATISLLVAVVLLAGGTRGARAVFMFVSESAVFNPVTGQVQFTIMFNQPPDFLTLDSVGRPANSFQYYIFGNNLLLPYPFYYDSIIRGGEIDITGNFLPIRNSRPESPDPTSGGWGAIRGVVSFSLNGNILTFSTPLGLISDHSTDGNFAYQLSASTFGSSTQYVNNRSTVMPEPSTAATTAVPLSQWLSVAMAIGILAIASRHILRSARQR